MSTLRYHPCERPEKSFFNTDLFVLKSHFNELHYKKGVHIQVIGATHELPQGCCLVSLSSQMRDVVLVVYRDDGELVGMEMATAVGYHVVENYDQDPLDDFLDGREEPLAPGVVESAKLLASEESLVGQRRNAYTIHTPKGIFRAYEPFIYTNVDIKTQMNHVNKNAKA